eukprot:7215458-Prymnesium_polylepis.1
MRPSSRRAPTSTASSWAAPRSSPSLRRSSRPSRRPRPDRTAGTSVSRCVREGSDRCLRALLPLVCAVCCSPRAGRSRAMDQGCASRRVIALAPGCGCHTHHDSCKYFCRRASCCDSRVTHLVSASAVGLRCALWPGPQDAGFMPVRACRLSAVLPTGPQI